MKKTVDFYYCDRCGKKISEKEHESEKNYVELVSCCVRHLCKECYAEYKPKETELLNWLVMNGNAAVMKRRFVEE